MNILIALIYFFYSSINWQLIDFNSRFKCEQLVIVTTDSWNTIEGKMAVYEYRENNWVTIYNQILIVVGQNGMAWGKGLQKGEPIMGKIKKEGDGNSPAGIFHLTGLFGYQDIRSKMNSLKVDESTFCVDDSKSVYYNQIVKLDTVKKDWNSAETMRMKSEVYKFGIFVDYNVKPAIPNRGSCIFMHIWSGRDKPTVGCTAMKETDILKLIGFLERKKNPILIQMPKEEYMKLSSIYKLP
ncbi:MAG: hypothetical protein FJY21_03365 [Bacteroidetes bacterium]|nr:hypothetical protein [Bacteroidota bacterium]